jgi:hypothetical protein
MMDNLQRSDARNAESKHREAVHLSSSSHVEMHGRTLTAAANTYGVTRHYATGRNEQELESEAIESQGERQCGRRSTPLLERCQEK